MPLLILVVPQADGCNPSIPHRYKVNDKYWLCSHVRSEAINSVFLFVATAAAADNRTTDRVDAGDLLSLLRVALLKHTRSLLRLATLLAVGDCPTSA